MKKLIACLFGLILSMPAWADTPIVYENLVDFTTAYGRLGTLQQSNDSVTFTPNQNANDHRGISFSMPVTAGHKILISATITTEAPYRVGTCQNKELGYFSDAVNVTPGTNVQYAAIKTVVEGRNGYFGFRTDDSLLPITVSNIKIFDLTEIYGADNEPANVADVNNLLKTQCQTYTSTTGTVTQNGTPTPENPVYPTFSKQGNMPELRAVGNIADSYDATTGKITRRIGVKVLDGTESWIVQSGTYSYFRWNTDSIWSADQASSISLSSHFLEKSISINNTEQGFSVWNWAQNNVTVVSIRMDDTYVASAETLDNFKQWLADQYNAGTPVTVYYPLVEGSYYEETWPSRACTINPIKIATNKFTNAAFSDVVAGLNTAISTIKTVVANTIAQTTAIGNLQSGKQTKPADAACPAGKKCLLVEDSNGTPHWYEIVESYYNPTLPVGYTELAYLESSAPAADAYIDTGLNFNSNYIYEITYSKGGRQNVVMGARKDSNWSAQGNFSLTYSTETCVYSSTEDASTNVDFDDSTYGVQHTVKYQQSTRTLLFDGTDKWKSTWITSVEIPYNVYLFAFNNVGSPGGARTEYVRIYSYTVKDTNGNLIQQFIPARNANNVLGMYDLANGQFYTNAGTGTFTAGPVVLPAGYTALQYIQSNGTQYIDSGRKANQNTEVSVTFKVDTLNSNGNRLLGNYGDLNNSFTINGVASGKSRFGAAFYNMSSSFSADVLYTVSNGPSGLISNGTTLTSWGTQNFETAGNVALLASTDSTGAVPSDLTNGLVGKTYQIIWKENGSIAMNLVPAKQGNIVGMYDLVSGQFFTNQGTGTFTAGPVAQ